MRILRTILLLILASSPAWSQFTTVTGTVTDPNGLPYAFGTIASQIVSSSTPKFTATGQVYIQPVQATGLNAAGQFTVTLADNTQLTPGGSTWTFTVCSSQGTVNPSFGKGPVCFVVSGVTISGSAQSISSTLNASALALTANFGGAASCSGCTTNGVVLWTGSAFGNSAIAAAPGAQVIIGDALRGGALSSGNTSLISTFLNSSGTCGGTIQIPLPAFGCGGMKLLNQPSGSTYTAGSAVSNFSSVVITNSTANIGLLVGGYISLQSNSTSYATEGRALYVESYVNGGVTPTTQRGIYVFNGAAGANGNITTQEGIVISENFAESSSGTLTNDYGLHILSPSITAGTVSNHTGIQIEDQTTTGGGTNSNPSALITLGTAKSSFGGRLKIADQGSCTMSSGACTAVNLSATYSSAPQCVATWTGTGTLAGTLKVASTTTTVTPSSSTGTDTAQVNWICFGN